MHTGMTSLPQAQRLPTAASWCLVLTGIAIAAVGSLLHLRGNAWFERWNHQVLDALIVHTAPQTPARHTVVVDIDDASLEAVGQWPWPRYRLAQLVQRIAAVEPAAIGIDILFPEEDRTSLAGIKAAFKRDFDVDLEFSGAPDGLTDNDGYFAQVLHDTAAVVADYFFFEHTTETSRSLAPTVSLEPTTSSFSPVVAPGMLLNTPAIADGARYRGFINTLADADGTLRRMPLVIAHGGTLHPSLALATALRARGLDRAVVGRDDDGPYVEVGATRMPVDARGNTLLRFNGGSQHYPALSAKDLLRGAVDPRALSGKVVFVGSSAAGLNDVHVAAVDRVFPGLKVQAAMAENLLTGRVLAVPSWSSAFILAACVLTGALMSALFVLARNVWSMLLGSGATAGLLIGCVVLLAVVRDVFLAPAAPLAVLAMSFVVFASARYALERRRAQLWFKRTENARQVTLESMAAVAETRDPETGAHIKRTQHYVKAIACELRRAGFHPTLLTPSYIELLFASAPLHDIGKVGVPDHILLKPGKLTDDEFVQMKRHAEFGRSIVANTERLIEGENFLVLAGEIAATHHEKWDGSGYPLGLRGEDIPLSGRIMAVADVYDALISRRCYKPPFTHDDSVAIMREQRGTSFDPVVLDAFFAIEEEIKRIAATYRDAAE